MTTLVAFITWLVKSLVEKPITESKDTFNKYFEKRIEILTEIKTRLHFIAYFPVGKENLDYKEQLQSILLRDGKAGYLSKEIYDNVLKISIDPNTDEELLLATITKLDNELYLTISKVQDEISFYRRFSNYNPLKRFIGYTLLFLQYIISIFIVISVLILISSRFFNGNNYMRLGIFLIAFLSVYFIDKWLRK